MTFAQTLHDQVRAHAQAQPERVFCHFERADGTQRLRYGELYAGALRYAALLRAQGLQPGDTVNIVLPHGPDQALAFVGAQLGGFIPSFLAPPNERQDGTHYRQQLRAQCQRIDRGLLLTAPELASLFDDALAGTPLRLATTGQLPAGKPEQPAFRAVGSDIALLQHSSGTTGARKGVALSHHAVLDQLDRYAQMLALTPADTIVSWLPLYHDMGLISSFLLPMMTGTPLVLLDPFEWVAAPATLLSAISRHRATLCWLPNFAFHFLARVPLPAATADGLDLSSVRAFINCSEPCKAEAFEVFERRFAPMGLRRDALQICYAMAETVFAVTQTPPGQPVQALVASRQGLLAGRILRPRDEADRVSLMPVGNPLPGARIHVVADNGRACADGEVGELQIEAPFLFSGYHREPELSAAALNGTRYASGDLGAWHGGRLYITGRKKDLVIVNGKNYYVHDIEAVVNAVPGVKPGRCVAFGLYHPGTGSEVVHVVAESSESTGAPDTHAELARRIKEAVQAALTLSLQRVRVVQGPWLVKTTSGKISRRENRDKYLMTEAQP